ncbi:MAG: heat-inducible transcriptional repressor HrcA [Bacteroidota bacterium]|nr:heat-inducible transcriptional repressor HrcA [Bacteroidota bacterium]
MLEIADKYGLTLREALVLQHVIRQYIATANPVGSRTVSKQLHLNLSPATIRNIMADLEDKGLLGHPHTSAGRVPTDKGYRCYVDTLMQGMRPKEEDVAFIETRLEDEQFTTIEDVIRKCTHILSAISHQLALVSVPLIGNGRLEHIELVPVSSSRVMVILSIMSGIIKSIVFEVDSEIPRHVLQELASALNERLGGLTLREIRETLPDRIRDTSIDAPSIVELIIKASDRLFSDELDEDRVYIDGVGEVTQHPEFSDPVRLRRIIELVENRNIIIHVLDSVGDSRDVTIRIGSEFEDSALQEYSMIAAPYAVGSAAGRISIIGPRRMDYDRLIPIVDYIATYLSNAH